MTLVKTMQSAIGVLLAAGLMGSASSALADVSFRIAGQTLTVMATPGSAGNKLLFVWDTTDKGDDPAAWAHSQLIACEVAAEGGRYELDLVAAGVAEGSACGIASVCPYKVLDSLGMFSGAYVDTGVKDTACYGVAFGFYAPEKSCDWAYFIGTVEGNGFQMGLNSSNLGSWNWAYRNGKKLPRPLVKTDSINEVDFHDAQFWLNGSRIQPTTTLDSGSVGLSGNSMRVGRAHDWRVQSGWWSHVEFVGSDGKSLIEYVPVQLADGTVRFYDRVSKQLVAPTEGAFTAGTPTGETIDTFLPHRAFVARDFVPLSAKLEGSKLQVVASSRSAGAQLLLVWDDADKGDQPDAWSNSQVLAKVISANGGSFVVDLALAGVRNGQACSVIAAHRFRRLDMLKMADSKAYVDTGVADSDCYGVSLGFYGSEASTAFATFIGTGDDGFTVGANNTSVDSWFWAYQGSKGTPRPSVKTDSTNEISFVSPDLTVNGAVENSTLSAGPVGRTGRSMHVGTWADRNRFLYGWWSFVRFIGADGEAVLDYVPVKRTADDKIGFFDRAKCRFVTSTGGGDFIAGTEQGEVLTVVDSRCTFIPQTVETVDVALSGTLMTVKVPASFANDRLLLVWDDEDRGNEISAWANCVELSSGVPEGGGSFSNDLAMHSIGKDQACCVLAARQFALLDKVGTADGVYIDTEFTDTQCASVGFGFYAEANTLTGGWGCFIGVGEADNGFVMSVAGVATPSAYFWNAYGHRAGGAERPSVSTSSINDIAFENGVVTANGTTVTSGLSGSIGRSGGIMRIGAASADRRVQYGWWSYARLGGLEGNALMDLIPARRIPDGAVGFFDRTARRFRSSTGASSFVAGAVTNESVAVSHARQAFSLSGVIASAAWTGTGTAGKLDDPANWACTNYYGEKVSGVPSDLTVVSGVPVKDFNCPPGSGFRCQSIAFAAGELTSALDWRGIDFSIVTGGPIDLAGHDLQVSLAKDAAAASIVADTVGGGVLTVHVPEGATAANTGVTLTGGLKLVKDGLGVYVAAKAGQSYAGGTEVRAGTFACGGNGTDGIYVADGTVSVGPGATFDLNGYAGHTAAAIVLAGGTLANSRTCRDVSEGWISGLSLTADSFVRADAVLELAHAGREETALAMNGYVLTVDVASVSEFALVNTTVTGGGRIYGRKGGFLRVENVRAPTTALEINYALNVSAVSTFLDYNACYVGGWDKGPQNPVKVLRRFTVCAADCSWHSVELADGSTLDLSKIDGIWTVPFSRAHFEGDSVLSFAPNATIKVDAGSREIMRGDQLAAWNRQCAVRNHANFIWASVEMDLPISARAAGLFALPSPGLGIFVR